jgi:hypothetical protein
MTADHWIIPVEVDVVALSDDGVEELPSVTFYVEVEIPDDGESP